jgi:hypothetical protein
LREATQHICLAPDEATKELLQNAMADLIFSARAYDRILRWRGRLRILPVRKRFPATTFQRRFSIVPWTGNCGREPGFIPRMVKNRSFDAWRDVGTTLNSAKSYD